jgi:hypothetical protein
MSVKRGLLVFGMVFTAVFLKDLAFPGLRGWPNWLLVGAIGGIAGYVAVAIEDKA